VDQASFLYERSKELFKKGTLTKVDEFRAKQGLLEAANDLNTQRESFSLALDRFKIALGLPTDQEIEIAEEEITPRIVTVDLSAAVDTALGNRLDLVTARQNLEDTERSVEIARNRLLPVLEFFAEAGASSESGEKLFDYDRDETGASAGLRLSNFLDKKSERNSYRSALVDLARQRRSYTLAEDNVKLDVRDTVSRLRQAEVTLAIQQEQVTLAEDTLAAAVLQLERGENTNRDVVDAQTQLQSARNALVQAQVDYIIAEIELRRDIGTLRVDERGQWH
jgi:outer membrane protein TolC